jgi:hypothetical protein
MPVKRREEVVPRKGVFAQEHSIVEVFDDFMARKELSTTSEPIVEETIHRMDPGTALGEVLSVKASTG